VDRLNFVDQVKFHEPLRMDTVMTAETTLLSRPAALSHLLCSGVGGMDKMHTSESTDITTP
jgi:hypothetical protein